MNKSKFLKKSLAAILSVLLVVAMIPLSVAAVFEPIIWVNDIMADHSAGSSTYAVKTEVADVTAVKITSNMLAADGRLYAVTGEGDAKVQVELIKSNEVDLTQYGTKSGDTYTLTLENRYNEKDYNGVREHVDTYTLRITNESVPIDKQRSIAKVVSNELYDPSSYVIDETERTITMILPFGAAIPTINTNSDGNVNDTFVPVSSKATVSYTPDSPTAGTEVGKIGTVLVTAAGGTKKYTVKAAYKDLFTSLSIDKEVEHTFKTKWSATSVGDGSEEVAELEVTMPYGTKTKTIVPTFGKGITISKIEYTNNATDTRTLNSGDTLPMYIGLDSSTIGESGSHSADTNGIIRSLVVTRDDGKKFKVKVTVKDLLNNPNAKLTSVKIIGTGANAGKDSNEIEFGNATNVPVMLPAGYQDVVANIEVKGSEGAKVQIVEQNIGEQAITTGVATLNSVNVWTAQSNRVIELQVTSADGDTVARYKITVSIAAKDEAFLTAFTLKNPDTKETFTVNNNWTRENDGSYSAILSVPYTYKMTTNLNALKVYAATSVGAKITTTGITTAASASANNGETVTAWFGASGTADVDVDKVFIGTDGKKPTGPALVIQVEHGPTEHNTYTVYFRAQTPKTGHGLRGLTFSSTDTYSQVTANNSYSTSIGMLPVKNPAVGAPKNVETIKVSVPYSYTTSATNYAPVNTNMYFYDLKVDDGAKLLFNDGSQAVVLDPEKYGSQVGTTAGLALSHAEWFDRVSDGKIDLTKMNQPTAMLYVVSEKAWVDADGATTAFDSSDEMDVFIKNVEATRYYVYGERAKAETGSDILSIESTLDPNVEVSLNNAKNEINLTVPYSYNTNPSNGKLFSLNFTASKLAKVTLPNATSSDTVAIKSDLGTKETTDRTYFYIYNGHLCVHSSSTGFSSNEIVDATAWSSGTPGTASVLVTAEDGVTTSNYTIKFQVADVQEGAELTKVQVGSSTATPVGTAVNLSVPVGTVLNPQKLNLTVSKMATVTINGQDWTPDKNYDLTSDLEITVTSESGTNHNTYVLKTTVSEGFSDVRTTDWFYNEVTKAAKEGWIKGVSDGIFNPYGTMTRAQFALVIARMHGGSSFDENAEVECPFPDVNGTAYQAAAKYVYDHNIMQGDGINFNPNKAITRQEAAIVLCKFKGIAPVTGGTSYVDNSKIAGWAVDYVQAATVANIFQGDTANAFNPTKALKRCEGAAILVRAEAK